MQVWCKKIYSTFKFKRKFTIQWYYSFRLSRYTDEQDFINNLGHRIYVVYDNYGQIKRGTFFNFYIKYTYGSVDSGDFLPASFDRFTFINDIVITKEYFADKDYENIGELLKDKFEDYRFDYVERTDITTGKNI